MLTAFHIVDAILKYQAHLAQDLPNKLAKAKESIEQHLSCVLTETADLPKQFNESCKELSTPLGDLELQIQLRDTNEVYTQPLNKRFENFRAIVKKETANLEQLWERHAAVLDKLEALKSSMASAGQDQNGRARGASTELSYAQNVQQIQRKYKQDRDNVLKRYQKESSGLSERVSKYLDVSRHASYSICRSFSDTLYRPGRRRRSSRRMRESNTRRLSGH